MATLILTQPQVRELLSMRACMDVVADALAQLARGAGVNPLRSAIRLPGSTRLLGLMPAQIESEALGSDPILGLKALAISPDNHGTRYDSHQGVVILFEPRHGLPEAILDASEITAIRTAAASGVATRLLAREDAGELAILGSGVQARSHLEAMAVARDLRRVRVYSPNAAHRAAFVARARGEYSFELSDAPSARAAVEGADIVCTVTSSRTPVLEGSWLAPGAHLNAVGACVPTARELDGPAIARARLFVDRRESALAESGDYLLALAEGHIEADHIVGEIGELLTGARAGRRSPREITLFKSLGLAVEDLAAAKVVVAMAREQGVGIEVELGGLKED